MQRNPGIVDELPFAGHVGTVVLMSRVDGKQPQKPSNTAVFGQSDKLGIGQDNRLAVTYLRMARLEKWQG